MQRRAKRTTLNLAVAAMRGSERTDPRSALIASVLICKPSQGDWQ